MNKKTLLITLLVVALLSALAVAGILAYLVDEGQVDNVFKIGDIEVEITEPGWTPDTGEDFYPGDGMIKDVKITAQKGDMYFRVIMTFVDLSEDNELADKVIITDPARIALIEQTIRFDPDYEPFTLKSYDDLMALPNMVNPNFTFDNTRGGDGEFYYNYNGILTEGNFVYFITNIVIDEEFTQEDHDILGRYAVTFRVEAVQAKNIADVDAAMLALDASFHSA